MRKKQKYVKTQMGRGDLLDIFFENPMHIVNKCAEDIIRTLFYYVCLILFWNRPLVILKAH